MNLTTSQIISKSFRDLFQKEIRNIILICFLLTCFFVLTAIYFFYVKFINPLLDNFYIYLKEYVAEIYFLNYLLTFKFFGFILSLFKFFFIFLKFWLINNTFSISIYLLKIWKSLFTLIDLLRRNDVFRNSKYTFLLNI